MATTIANLNVRLTASTAAFARGMKNSIGKINNMKRSIGLLRGSLGRYGATIAAIAGPAAIGAFIKNQFSTLDVLGKLSDQLGISTQALQTLQFAAQITGVETKQLSLGLRSMVRQISEAATGTGEAKDAIEGLGLQAQELNRLSPGQQFLRIAAAIQQVENHADRVRFVADIFGSRQTGLVNTLMLGESGIRDMNKQLKDMGVLINRESIKPVEEANDAWTTFKTQLGLTGQVIATQLAPSIRDLNKDLTAMLQTVQLGKGGKSEASGFDKMMASLETGRFLVERSARGGALVGQAAKDLFSGLRSGGFGPFGNREQQGVFANTRQLFNMPFENVGSYEEALERRVNRRKQNTAGDNMTNLLQGVRNSMQPAAVPR